MIEGREEKERRNCEKTYHSLADRTKRPEQDADHSISVGVA
jgi:hypothetical protein